MPNINEATDADLKIIEELKKLNLKPGDTLLNQQEYALTPQQQKQFEGRKSIKPDITLVDLYNINSEEFKQVATPIPPIETQRQIVEKLDRQMQALESVRLLKSEAQKRIEEILARVWGELVNQDYED